MIDIVTLAGADEIIPLGMILAGMVWIVASYTSSIAKTKAREESRREIAAYVAEGTISPDDAVRLINAGRPAHEIGKSEKA
ncbi:MAG: hypothetical protein IT434_05920 [Phycisphaerales bacterium]|jgi:hypothetical protein|nr:hypothetical protein [Phycisphaerales bacterium]